MRRLRLLVAVVILGAAAAAALSDRWPWQRLEVAAPPITITEAFRRRSDTLKAGETLGALFARNGIPAPDLGPVLKLLGVDPRRVRAGTIFGFHHKIDQAVPTKVVVRTSPELRVWAVRLDSATWTAERRPIPWSTDTIRIAGSITSSLYDALDEAPDAALLGTDDRVRLAWDLADVYAWSVDFSRDLKVDDRFVVLVERHRSAEGERRMGRIVAGELELEGRPFQAFHFADGGSDGFFDEQGQSLRRAFLQAPVEFRRISSGFSRSRLHPILGIWRSHDGTDYAATSGTPVMAAGDGVVLQAGWSGGYGRLLEVRRLSGITTRYGHLRGFAAGIGPGTRVRQGQVVGYVGATGLATAAHLHYEFRVNGVARDARTVDLGHGEPVASPYADRFFRERTRLLALLHRSPPSQPVPVLTE